MRAAVVGILLLAAITAVGEEGAEFMAARITIERLLRDDDDDVGQSIRDWKIESERHGVAVRMKHGTGFLIMRPDDVDLFIADLQHAKEAALSLHNEPEKA